MCKKDINDGVWENGEGCQFCTECAEKDGCLFPFNYVPKEDRTEKCNCCKKVLK